MSDSIMVRTLSGNKCWSCIQKIWRHYNSRPTQLPFARNFIFYSNAIASVVTARSMSYPHSAIRACVPPKNGNGIVPPSEGNRFQEIYSSKSTTSPIASSFDQPANHSTKYGVVEKTFVSGFGSLHVGSIRSIDRC